MLTVVTEDDDVRIRISRTATVLLFFLSVTSEILSLQASVSFFSPSPIQMCIPNFSRSTHTSKARLCEWETHEKIIAVKLYLVLKFKILGWNCSDDKESCALMDSLARLSNLSAYASCESSSRPDLANERISTKMKRIRNMIFDISIECVHSFLMFSHFTCTKHAFFCIFLLKTTLEMLLFKSKLFLSWIFFLNLFCVKNSSWMSDCPVEFVGEF